MKIKKLVLNKEVVARINNDEMNRLRGGDDGPYYTPVDNTYVAKTYYDPPIPDPPVSTEFNPEKCPNYSQHGSGCYGETCGYAFTCNG